LTRKERSILQITAVNAAAAAFCLAVSLLLPGGVSGFWGYLFAGLMYMLPVPRGLFLLRKPLNANKMLGSCELSALGTGIFLLVQLGNFSSRAVANVLCVLALIANIAALSSMRIRDTSKTDARGGTGPKHWLFLAVLMALFLFTAIALSLLLPFGRGAALAALGAVGNFLMMILRRIWQFLIFLVSLIPAINPVRDEGSAPAPLEARDAEAQMGAGLPLDVVIIILAIIAAAIIALFVYIIYRSRRARLGKLRVEYIARNARSTAPSLVSLLRGALRRIRERFSLYLSLLTRLNSYAGVEIRVEYRGKHCGIPRRNGQTTREFLMLLRERAPYEDLKAREAFSFLADRIDELCFSMKSPQGRMDRASIRAMLKTVKPARKRTA